MGADNHIAWHYTTGQKFLEIVRVGYLDPKATVTLAGERSILWFSRDQYWEPTAQKSLVTGQLLGMIGTYQHGGGLVRFGIPQPKLIGWPDLGGKAGISPDQIKILETVGVEQGATPSNWCGSFGRIRTNKCLIDCLHTSGEWQRV
jgi:hypothetical protein